LEQALEKKQSSARQLGINTAAGNYAQLLGTWKFLTEYETLVMLSSTSAQLSLDLMGFKDDRLDFLEIKKEGSSLTTSERKLKKLVDSGQLKLSYKVLDVKMPDGANISTR